jgi:hypothetical protein
VLFNGYYIPITYTDIRYRLIIANKYVILKMIRTYVRLWVRHACSATKFRRNKFCRLGQASYTPAKLQKTER